MSPRALSPTVLPALSRWEMPRGNQVFNLSHPRGPSR